MSFDDGNVDSEAEKGVKIISGPIKPYNNKSI